MPRPGSKRLTGIRNELMSFPPQEPSPPKPPPPPEESSPLQEPSSPQEPPIPPEPRPASGVAETLFAALTSALLFSLFLLLPLAGSAALAFAGVPLVRLAHRRGLAAGAAAAALSSGILAALGWTTGGISDAAAAAVLAAVSMALPVVFSGWVRRGASASRAFLFLGAAGFALLSGALLLREATIGRSVRTEIGAAFDAMTPASGAPAAAGKSPLDPETAARMKATFTRFKEFAQSYWLGLVGASWVLAAAIAFYVGAWSARPAPSAELTRFEALRVPAPVVALFAVSGAGFALLPGAWRTGAGDLLLPLSALYFLAGLSIICHFARRWFRARILRAGLYALVIYFPLNVAVALLGIFDWYADFRRRGEKA